MIILTPYVIAGLVGKMYVQLSMNEDKSLSYMSGFLDVVHHYDNALKAMIIFQPNLTEVPVRKRLFHLKYMEYDKKILTKKEKDYMQGKVDANNFLFEHVNVCYRK